MSSDTSPRGADRFSPAKRSEIMARVRSKNTKPEIRLRSLLHRLGYRFRLHSKDLPGNPDIVLPKHRAVVFVHGCFWHQHPGCRKATIPENNRDTWERKLYRNVERDRENLVALRELGWRTAVVWECELRDEALMTERLSPALPDFASRLSRSSNPSSL